MPVSTDIRPTGVAATRSRAPRVVAVIACFFGLAFGYTCTYGAVSTTFVLPLVSAFGWGRFVPSVMYASSMLGMMLASLWLGQIIERFGEARVALASGLCLACVMMLDSTMNGVPAIAIALAFCAGLVGAGTGHGLYVALMPKWFERNLGRALGVVVIGQSVGAALMPPIAAATTAAHGWRTGYRTLAAIELAGTAVVVVMLFWLRRHRDSAVLGRERAGRAGLTIREAARTRSFWLLEAMIFLQTVGMFGIMVHLYPIYHDLGVDWRALPKVLLSIAVGTAVGRLGSGLLFDWLDARIVAIVLFLAGGVAAGWLATLTTVSSAWVLILPPALVGMALGAETDVLAYMSRRLFGLRHYSIIFNRLLIGYFAGTMAGPLVIGWAFDHLGNGHVALWGLAGSCALAAILTTLLPAMGRMRVVTPGAPAWSSGVEPVDGHPAVQR